MNSENEVLDLTDKIRNSKHTERQKILKKFAQQKSLWNQVNQLHEKNFFEHFRTINIILLHTTLIHAYHFTSFCWPTSCTFLNFLAHYEFICVKTVASSSPSVLLFSRKNIFTTIITLNHSFLQFQEPPFGPRMWCCWDFTHETEFVANDIWKAHRAKARVLFCWRGKYYYHSLYLKWCGFPKWNEHYFKCHHPLGSY